MKARTLMHLIAVVVFCSASYGAQQNANEVEKSYVRFAVRPEYTRFLVFFKGPLKVTQAIEGNTLTLSVADIKSAFLPGGVRKQFRSGLIESAIVEPVVNGSSRIVLTLRSGFTKYEIVQHDHHEAIWVDVYSKTQAQSSPVVAAKPQPKAQNAPAQPVKDMKKDPAQRNETKKQAAVKVSKKENNAQQVDQIAKSPLFDIGALARQQVEESARNSAPDVSGSNVTPVIRTSAVSTNAFRADGKQVLWLAGAVGSLVLTIGTILLLVRRLADRKKKVEQFFATKAAVQASRLDVQIGDEPQPEIGHSKGSADTIAEQERIAPSDSDDTAALTFASQYQRNQGDVELAIRLRDSIRKQSHLSVARKIGQTEIPAKARITAAKKLGVGKGEVELASKLQRLAATKKETEVVE
ncbi:MAG TPA: hypothetical protein VMH23_12810 [Bacteroidota bacterium]|nr:hypothetical protein [Bacteroidota bacterium]